MVRHAKCCMGGGVAMFMNTFVLYKEVKSTRDAKRKLGKMWKHDWTDGLSVVRQRVFRVEKH